MKNLLVSSMLAMGMAAATVPATATTIGLYGSNSNAQIAAFLNSHGYATVQLGSLDNGTLSGLSAVILLRTDGNSALTSFVQNGGRLITEWSAATYGMGLLGGSATFAGYVGSNTSITFSQAGIDLGLSSQIGNSYAEGGETEYFYALNALGKATSYGTRPGNQAAIAGGAVGSGFAFVNAYDWADSFGYYGANTGRLLLNELGADVSPRPARVPEPASLALLGLGMLGIATRFQRRGVGPQSS